MGQTLKTKIHKPIAFLFAFLGYLPFTIHGQNVNLPYACTTSRILLDIKVVLDSLVIDNENLIIYSALNGNIYSAFYNNGEWTYSSLSSQPDSSYSENNETYTLHKNYEIRQLGLENKAFIFEWTSDSATWSGVGSEHTCSVTKSLRIYSPYIPSLVAHLPYFANQLKSGNSSGLSPEYWEATRELRFDTSGLVLNAGQVKSTPAERMMEVSQFFDDTMAIKIQFKNYSTITTQLYPKVSAIRKYQPINKHKIIIHKNKPSFKKPSPAVQIQKNKLQIKKGKKK